MAKTKVGKDTEIACRGNLAQCKINLKDYDSVIDQCERILEYDSNNVKANFRMSQAAFALSEGKSVSQLKVAMKYAEIAKKQQPTNSQVCTHFDQVKSKHDEVVAAQEESKAPTTSSEQ